jgi:trigger factor
VADRSSSLSIGWTVSCLWLSEQSKQGIVEVQTEPLPESKVKAEVVVGASEVERELQRVAAVEARRIKLPGFRKGRVPAELVIRRLGRETLLEEVVRERLGRWYAEALEEADLDPVGDPRIELAGLPGAGEPLRFSFEVGVLPKAKLGQYKGLEVGRREPRAEEREVEEELEAIRRRFARLEEVERPAQAGDFLIIDYRLFANNRELKEHEGRDELFELGRGTVLGELEQALLGAKAGEERRATVRFGADHPDRRLRNREVEFVLTVKAVREQRLPDLDDELAAGVGFSSLEELRAEVRRLVEEADRRRVEGEFREACLDAVVERSTIELPAEHVKARAAEIWERTLRRLAERGIGREAYLRVTGQTEEQLLERLSEYAAQTLRREAVLAAIVEAEGIEPTDEEVAQAFGIDSEEGLERLRSGGQLAELRDQLKARLALDRVVESAKPIPVERARAREQLWTPEQAQLQGTAGSAPSGLWTPGTSR